MDHYQDRGCLLLTLLHNNDASFPEWRKMMMYHMQKIDFIKDRTAPQNFQSTKGGLEKSMNTVDSY